MIPIYKLFIRKFKFYRYLWPKIYLTDPGQAMIRAETLLGGVELRLEIPNWSQPRNNYFIPIAILPSGGGETHPTFGHMPNAVTGFIFIG